MNIVIKELCKKYGDKVVLNHFSAEIKEGKVTCIMGKSGCGKTTLLHILMGIENVDSGEVTGVPKRIAAVFQEDRLCEDFSIASNLRLVRKGILNSEIQQTLCEIGLAECEKKTVRELSGGMKRRVAIARAILADSDLIILDEPIKGLDEGTKQSVIGFLKKRTVGKTVIIVTHDEDEAKQLGDFVIEMTESVL